uniref:Coiled-coil domain-containing protein 22 homolog n=2 Tax=Dendroctonus ponderosae TaxID=77166 RepID=A0AAR5Q7B7_DENPD
MFLLERLPKEANAAASAEPIGYVPKVVKQIEDTLRHSLTKMWIPSEALHFGARPIEHGFLVNSFGNSVPLHGINLIVADETTDPETASFIPNVIEQCSTPRQLLPSLLFPPIDYSGMQNWQQSAVSEPLARDLSRELLNSAAIEKLDSPSAAGDRKEYINRNSPQHKAEPLLNTLKEEKESLDEMQKAVKECEENLLKLKSQREQEQTILKELVAKVKVKNKTMAVLSNEENIVKLENLIKKGENRLVELANQWDEVQAPLLEEQKALKSSETRYTELQTLKKAYKEVMTDLKEKTALEQKLILKCKDLNNKNNRAAYTKRILEIVGNIQKQNKEIQKIISDTRQVQKDISNLTGQVDRSFTLSDEMIFHDCKSDESARKAYKYLAALREECNGILQAVSNIGQAERELRNLEEQIETEKNKDIRDKLDKVQRDLTEMKNEIEVLMR